MLHKRYEYRGVIVGMDPVCQADERWQRVRLEYHIDSAVGFEHLCKGIATCCVLGT